MSIVRQSKNEVKPLPLDLLVFDSVENKFFYKPSGQAWASKTADLALAHLALPMTPSQWLRAHPYPRWKAIDTIRHLTREWAYDKSTRKFRYLPTGELWSAQTVDGASEALRLNGKRIKASAYLKGAAR